jgi:riboflavin kinase/FMN adenylyltransferase
MIEGRSFNFGKGRGGNIERLREWSAGSGIDLDVIDAVTVALLDLNVVEVSSTLIRWLIGYGRVRDAAICLGRPYALRGQVIEGFHRGKELGVRTANLQCEEQLIPADGVYAGRCVFEGQTYAAAVSIGNLPTFEKHRHQIEAHLIGFEGDIYGKTIEVELLDWVREQHKFGSVPALIEQIRRDLDFVRDRVNVQAHQPIAAA